MPEILVHLAAGRTAAQKKSLMKDITDAVVKNCGVPPDRVVVQIVESPKDEQVARRGAVRRDAVGLRQRIIHRRKLPAPSPLCRRIDRAIGWLSVRSRRRGRSV